MPIIIYKIFVSIAVFVLMTGCRTYMLYQYAPATIKLPFEGSLIINLSGTYERNSKKNNRKITNFGKPYSLRFVLSVPSEYDLFKLEIKDIELTGEKSKSKIVLPNIESNNVKITRKKSTSEETIKKIMTSFQIRNNDFKYETYFLKATIFVYSSQQEFSSTKISATLKTDFKKEMGWDWFDKIMSV